MLLHELALAQNVMNNGNASSQNVTRNAVLGLLPRLSTTTARSRSELGPYWNGVACAMVLAVRHAATRNGQVVNELANITRTHFTEVARDSGSTAFSGIIAYRELLAHRVHAIVGAARSAVTRPLAQLGAVDVMPMMS